MRTYRMLHAAILTLLVGLSLNNPAYAIDAIDKNGKVIGEVIDIDLGTGTLFVARRHQNHIYLINVERYRLIGTDIIWYESPDCTGTPYMLSYPGENDEMIVRRSGTGADGHIYILISDVVLERTLRSLWSTTRNLCRNMDAPEEGEGNNPPEEFTTTVNSVGRLQDQFSPPYNIR